MIEHEFSTDFDAALAIAAEIAAIGERFGDRDLVAIALMAQGHFLIRLRRRAEGVRLVDEAMIAATVGELTPIVNGIVFCYTISFCRDVYELRRAREWTDALSRWCDAQPEMVAHKGLCLVHRAEIMTLTGAWEQAAEEASRVCRLFTDGALNRLAQGGAAYVVVYHQFKNPPVAFARGEKLIKNEGAPLGVRGLQFYPSSEGSAAVCLWEANSVEDVQGYVDSTLGDSSANTCWEVNAEMAFAERPLGIKAPTAVKG